MKDIDRERQTLQLADDFSGIQQTFDSNAASVLDGSMTMADAARANRLAVLDLKEAVYRYASEVKNIPPSQLTKVMTLIDRGSFSHAKAVLNALQTARRVDLWINPKLEPGMSGKFEVKPFAKGGILDKPQFLPLAGEAGPEVIIPLTDARRAMELMQQTGLATLAQGQKAAKRVNNPSARGNASPLAGNVTNVENKTVNFYGDLSFPNITDPTDASKFIDNLEMLAG